MLRLLPILATAVTLCACAASAPAQPVNRCVNADGSTAFTDRRCEDVGANARVPAATAAAAHAPALYRAGCARQLSDLVYQLRNAIAARDVNGVSGLYWWSGTSEAGANHALERLEAIVARPLVDIGPVFPEPPTGIAADADPQPGQAARRPTGLRLEQTLGDSATPARTLLELQQHYGCFWITLD